MEALWFWKPAPRGLAGSSPATPTIFNRELEKSGCSRLPRTEEIKGSNPLFPTKNLKRKQASIFGLGLFYFKPRSFSLIERGCRSVGFFRSFMAQNTQTAKLQFLNNDGIDILQSVGQGGGVQFSVNANGGLQAVAQPLASTPLTISGRLPGFYVITNAGIATITVSAPTAGVDDGLEIEIASSTNFAHIVAVGAGKLQMGQAAGAQVTFPAFAGAEVYLTAYQGKWIVATGGNGVYTVA